ncbi:hypothetical protein NKR19_g2996 [Coniochaeta hoffmannii]|uniref:BTB domain-containing protein n=1 Tax=Coniochaeta hoffmannii TaxID=91930 RepID=A0AA38RXV8_9PEZI|nr:hypothetical protein NKR19_g2996 [Coniochaeta hoffmannii]
MDSDVSDNEPTAMEVIDSEGDVIMVVGAKKREMLVNSNCLRLASNVFRNMLGPNWSEGQGVSKDDPPRVALEEDDPQAMKTIFYTPSPEGPSPQEAYGPGSP